MRTHLRRLIAAALSLRAALCPLAATLALTPLPAAAANCACGAASCAQVVVNDDNRVDFNCAPALVGQSLPDSDGDGIPDACDACPCAPNPLDPDTGRASECPAPPAVDTPTAGSTTPSSNPPSPNPPTAPAAPERIRCENGRVHGIPESVTIWRLRPQTYAFTRFQANSSELALGPELIVLHGLGAERCTTVDVGGKPSLRILPSEWHWRAAAFASGTLRVSKVGFDATTGLSGGIDHHDPTSAWSLGATLHAMTLLGSADPTPILLGVGPRVGLFDVVAITPFVQLDARSRFQASYGVWLNFDFGVLRDFGIEVERLTKFLQ